MSLTNVDILKNSLLLALEKSLGIITTACKSAGCSRETYYNYLKSDEEFKEKVEAISEMQLDFVESAHLKLVKDGNPTNIIFHLKTKGKSRGYQESLITENVNKNLNKDMNYDYSKLTNDELDILRKIEEKLHPKEEN